MNTETFLLFIAYFVFGVLLLLEHPDSAKRRIAFVLKFTLLASALLGAIFSLIIILRSLGVL